MDQIFENTAKAFVLKTDAELERAYFLFKLIANQPLVRIGTAVTNFAIKSHLPVEGLIRATVFDHFCGGVNEQDCMPVVDKMWEKGVSAILDYSVEGKDDEDPLDNALAITLKILDFVKEKDAIPFAVFKPTGYGRLFLYEKIGAGKALTKSEEIEWERVVNRFEQTCKKAHDLGVYRWDRMEYLKKLQKKATTEGFKIGIKAVRGAYMEKENERAEEMGYKSPICDSKEETDTNFNLVTTYILDHLETISLFVGTHNEESSYLLMELMKERGIPHNDPRIWFGQLFGMSDHISFNMAAASYNVAKYVPFGPVRDVMPYLIRRAEENTSVEGQTNRELELIKKERKRRKI
jgi:proline dehydrogenase